MSSPAYEERQRNKRLNLQYKKAAARLFGVDVHPYGEVKRMTGGAYVELVVWVPIDEALKEEAEA